MKRVREELNSGTLTVKKNGETTEVQLGNMADHIARDVLEDKMVESIEKAKSKIQGE